jgi:hypothetical protein
VSKPIYAKDTQVSVAKSKAELEATLLRYGASDTMSGTLMSRNMAFVAFRLAGRNVRINIPLPTLADFDKRKFRGRMVVAEPEWQHQAWEQACRSRWRAVVLATKAKLELVHAEITTIDAEFLSNIVLPGGGTIGEQLVPQLDNLVEVPLLSMAGGEP